MFFPEIFYPILLYSMNSNYMIPQKKNQKLLQIHNSTLLFERIQLDHLLKNCLDHTHLSIILIGIQTHNNISYSYRN